jgi:hypothetical protein
MINVPLPKDKKSGRAHSSQPQKSSELSKPSQALNRESSQHNLNRYQTTQPPDSSLFSKSKPLSLIDQQNIMSSGNVINNNYNIINNFLGCPADV